MTTPPVGSYDINLQLPELRIDGLQMPAPWIEATATNAGEASQSPARNAANPQVPTPNFRLPQAGLKLLQGTFFGSVGAGLGWALQNPLSAVALGAGAATLGTLGGPPAWFLMGAGALGVGAYRTLSKFSQATDLANTGRRLGAEYRFEEARRYFDASENVWGEAGATGVALGALGALVSKKYLGRQAQTLGLTLAKGPMGFFKNLQRGLFEKGFWAPGKNAFGATWQQLASRGGDYFAKAQTEAKAQMAKLQDKVTPPSSSPPPPTTPEPPSPGA